MYRFGNIRLDQLLDLVEADHGEVSADELEDAIRDYAQEQYSEGYADSQRAYDYEGY
jgi:hypothetical protein